MYTTKKMHQSVLTSREKVEEDEDKCFIKETKEDIS